MEPEKSKAIITTKPAAQAGSSGKGETMEEERASLVKSSKLPSYLQRRTVAADDEERKEKEIANKAATGKVVLLQTKN